MISLTLSSLLQVSLLAAPGTGAQTYDEAYKVSTETGRPLVVLVVADSCTDCLTRTQKGMPPLAKNG